MAFYLNGKQIVAAAVSEMSPNTNSWGSIFDVDSDKSDLLVRLPSFDTTDTESETALIHTAQISSDLWIDDFLLYEFSTYASDTGRIIMLFRGTSNDNEQFKTTFVENARKHTGRDQYDIKTVHKDYPKETNTNTRTILNYWASSYTDGLTESLDVYAGIYYIYVDNSGDSSINHDNLAFSQSYPENKITFLSILAIRRSDLTNEELQEFSINFWPSKNLTAKTGFSTSDAICNGGNYPLYTINRQIGYANEYTYLIADEPAVTRSNVKSDFPMLNSNKFYTTDYNDPFFDIFMGMLSGSPETPDPDDSGVTDKNDKDTSDPDQKKNPYGTNGVSNTGGGNKKGLQAGDNIQVESKPANGLRVIGFLSVYTPTVVQIEEIASKLWTNDFIDAINKLFTNPIDAIISLSLIPFDPYAHDVSAINKNCIIGKYDTGVTTTSPSNTFVRIDFGEIEIGHAFNGSFLDFAPFCEIEVYLPYIGFRRLQAQDIVSGLKDNGNKSIHLYYTVDIVSGACVAEIYTSQTASSKSVLIAQFPGNISYTVPVTSLNMSALSSTLLSVVSGSITSVAMMNPIPAAISAANSIANAGISYDKAGGIGSNFSYMAKQDAFVSIRYRNVNRPGNLSDFTGYPSMVTTTIAKGVKSGDFVKVKDINLNGIPATESEIEEIRELLEGGVFA